MKLLLSPCKCGFERPELKSVDDPHSVKHGSCFVECSHCGSKTCLHSWLMESLSARAAVGEWNKMQIDISMDSNGGSAVLKDDFTALAVAEGK